MCGTCLLTVLADGVHSSLCERQKLICPQCLVKVQLIQLVKPKMYEHGAPSKQGGLGHLLKHCWLNVYHRLSITNLCTNNMFKFLHRNTDKEARERVKSEEVEAKRVSVHFLSTK